MICDYTLRLWHQDYLHYVHLHVWRYGGGYTATGHSLLSLLVTLYSCPYSCLLIITQMPHSRWSRCRAVPRCAPNFLVLGNNLLLGALGGHRESNHQNAPVPHMDLTWTHRHGHVLMYKHIISLFILPVYGACVGGRGPKLDEVYMYMYMYMHMYMLYMYMYM